MSPERPVVLSLEDDPPSQRFVGRLLARLPVQPVLVSVPAQAIELARQVQPKLLMLGSMPAGISVWEVLALLRADSPGRDLRVMILSTRDSGAERLVAANVAQVDLFLAKPFDPLTLGRNILRLLDLPIDDDSWLASKGTG